MPSVCTSRKKDAIGSAQAPPLSGQNALGDYEGESVVVMRRTSVRLPNSRSVFNALGAGGDASPSSPPSPMAPPNTRHSSMLVKLVDAELGQDKAGEQEVGCSLGADAGEFNRLLETKLHLFRTQLLRDIKGLIADSRRAS